MASGSSTDRGALHRARISLGVSDELGKRVGRNRWVYLHHKWHAGDTCDGRNVANEVETELFIERRIDRVPRSGQEERIAVRWCLHHCLSADIPDSAGTTLDDKLLTEAFG